MDFIQDILSDTEKKEFKKQTGVTLKSLQEVFMCCEESQSRVTLGIMSVNVSANEQLLGRCVSQDVSGSGGSLLGAHVTSQQVAKGG